MSFLTESIVEDAALTWFGELGYEAGNGPRMAPGEPTAERASFGDVVPVGRLREAVRHLNRTIPAEAREEALRKVLRVYADKPMQGHGLMQAIARVNRVFRDKPGGLVVDYLGLADQLKHALANYTESGGKGDPTYDTRQAIAVMLKKRGVACNTLLHRSRTDQRCGPHYDLRIFPAPDKHPG